MHYILQIAYCGDINILETADQSLIERTDLGIEKAPYIAVQLPQHYGEPQSTTQWSICPMQSANELNGYEGKPVKEEVCCSR